jgi:histidine triad (HIT) family protein
VTGDPCVFCEIVAGTRDQEIVHEDELVVAFLCEPPATWGHTLVVPRRHRQDIWSIRADEAAAATAVAQSLAAVLRDDLGATGINLRQNSGPGAGQDVFHYHLHVVPRYADDTVQPGCVWGSPPWQPPAGGHEKHRRVAATIRAALAAHADSAEAASETDVSGADVSGGA